MPSEVVWPAVCPSIWAREPRLVTDRNGYLFHKLPYCSVLQRSVQLGNVVLSRGLSRGATGCCVLEPGAIVRCLALNASFEPLTLVPVRRALRLVLDGKAEIVESDGKRLIRSARLSVPKPTVIRLVRFIHVPRKFRRQVTNTFLFARDNYTCQYCGRSQSEFKFRECLTRDHLVPLSRGGTNDWTNVMTACSSCNTRKGNRLPEQCGMHPLKRPVEPHFVYLTWAVRKLTPVQAKYIRMFYGAGTLHELARA